MEASVERPHENAAGRLAPNFHSRGQCHQWFNFHSPNRSATGKESDGDELFTRSAACPDILGHAVAWADHEVNPNARDA